MEKKSLQPFLLAVALIVALFCGTSRNALAAYPQTITSSSPFVNLPRPTDDPMWAEAFAHWDKREDMKEAQAAGATFDKLQAKFPNKFESHLWVLRAYYLIGMRDKSKRAEHLNKAIAAGEKGKALKPGYDPIVYWLFATIAILRPFTEAEIAEIQKLGAKYTNTRDLVVPADDKLWKDALKLWDGRWDRATAIKAVHAFNDLDNKYPNRIETKLWLARANYWLHYITDNDAEKKTWLLAGYKYAQKAMTMEPRNPAACWWAAASIGQYISLAGPVEMAKHSLEVTRLLQVVLEEDPNYFYGGVSQFLALSFARAGKLARKATEMLGFTPELIERIITFASSYEPRYLRNHVALAELYIAQGKKEEARKKLEIILNANPKALPLMEPENLHTQKLAKEMMSKL